MYLGIKLVIAKSIERIHKANLINFAITPATFVDPADYARIEAGDQVEAADFSAALKDAEHITIKNVTKGMAFDCKLDLTDRERAILRAGGKLNYTKAKS